MRFRYPTDGRRTAEKILAQREACRIPALRGLPGHLDLLPTAFPNQTACYRKQGWTQCCLPSHLPPCWIGSSVLPVGEAQNGRGREDQPPLINPGPFISPCISHQALHSLHGQLDRGGGGEEPVPGKVQWYPTGGAWPAFLLQVPSTQPSFCSRSLSSTQEPCFLLGSINP